jgi:aminoglycoside phosphotransferase family enzyme/predicted kinase
VRRALTTEADQTATVAFLSQPDTYGVAGPVEVIETHISRVFLAGERVYKLKRAVRFPYLDFTDPAVRERACRDELRLNRRTAPQLYLDVVAVTRGGDGTLALGGSGAAIDWLVVMRRFAQELLFDRLAVSGRLTRAHIEELAETLVRFHAAAEIDRTRGGHGAMAAVARENMEVLRSFAADRLDAAKVARLGQATDAQLATVAPVLDARRDAGWVRRCHGDLHLRNIVLLDGRPTPFDCIEFNDDFAVIDVMYDLAFLIMDLEHRRARELANALLNRTLDLTGDIASVTLLPLFLALRATVRSHVAAAQGVFEDARAFLDLGLGFLEAESPVLVAVGGLSGSGKSSLARVIAPAVGAAPGAVVVRSDVTRKRLAGVGLTERLDAAAYTPDAAARVYASLLAQAEPALRAGHSVVLDAVSARPEERRAAAELARRMGVPFRGLWLDVPLAVRAARIGGRVSDASDATPAVARTQETFDLGAMDWTMLDGSADLEALKIQALSAL